MMTLSPGSKPAVVLVVDDEALLRMLAIDVLEEAGFKALEAESADAALLALHARPEIRVLFTDVDMPGSLDGLELARVTHDRWPDVGVLIVSGKVRPDPAELPAGSLFIPKPYQPEALVHHVREMIRAA
jgi:DNA-binding NtrC family response regulator